MTWLEPSLRSTWHPAHDVDTAALWAASGAQWLTARGVAVPARLVRGVVGLTRHLDAHGAGLADIVGAEGVGVLAERAAALGMRPASDVTAGGAGRLLEARDGWLVVSLARPEDIETIPAWLGCETDPLSYWATVADAVRTRDVAELVERGCLLGLPVGAVGEMSDDRPVLVRTLGDAPPRNPDSLVVANLAPLWAGPLAADLLARMGARVIKVESTSRPDGARRAGPFFEALHGRCESFAVDFRSAEGRERLAALLSSVDVVIEGSRPRALEQLGIDAPSLVRSGPQIWVSITGHGRDEAHRERVGFGDDAAACGGLVGWVGGRPQFIADAVADPLCGLTAAAAVVDLAAAGGRRLVDIALSRVAASFVGPADDGTVASDDPARPRRRSDPGASLPMGADNDALFAEFAPDTGVGVR